MLADKKSKGKTLKTKPKAFTSRKMRKKVDLIANTPSAKKALRFNETSK